MATLTDVIGTVTVDLSNLTQSLNRVAEAMKGLGINYGHIDCGAKPTHAKFMGRKDAQGKVSAHVQERRQWRRCMSMRQVRRSDAYAFQRGQRG